MIAAQLSTAEGCALLTVPQTWQLSLTFSACSRTTEVYLLIVSDRIRTTALTETENGALSGGSMVTASLESGGLDQQADASQLTIEPEQPGVAKIQKTALQRESRARSQIGTTCTAAQAHKSPRDAMIAIDCKQSDGELPFCLRAAAALGMSDVRRSGKPVHQARALQIRFN